MASSALTAVHSGAAARNSPATALWRLPATPCPGIRVRQDQLRLYYLTVDYDLGWSHFTETTSYNTLTTIGSQDYTGEFAPIFDPIYNNPDLGFAAAYNISHKTN